MNKIIAFGLIGIGVIAGAAIALRIFKSKTADVFKDKSSTASENQTSNESSRSIEVKKDNEQNNADFDEVATKRNETADIISKRHREAGEMIQKSVSEIFNDEEETDNQSKLDEMKCKLDEMERKCD